MPQARTIEFANIHEALEFVSNVSDVNHSRKFKDSSFCKYSWDDTIKAFRDGWPKGVKNLLNISDTIDAKLAEIEESWNIKYDVTGEYIDMGRYVVGEPECCGSVVRDVRYKPVVNIAVDCAVPWFIDTDAIERRGAVILSLVEQLRKDHIVKMHLYLRMTNVYRKGEPHEDAMVIFGIDTVCEFSRDLLAAYLAHPGTFRRLVFAMYEKMFDTHDLSNCSYGLIDSFYEPPMDPSEKHVHFRPIRENTDWQYLEKNVEWIVKQLNRLRNQEDKDAA